MESTLVNNSGLDKALLPSLYISNETPLMLIYHPPKIICSPVVKLPLKGLMSTSSATPIPVASSTERAPIPIALPITNKPPKIGFHENVYALPRFPFS